MTGSAELEGEWSLLIEEGPGTPERFTVRDGEVSSASGPVGRFALAADRATLALPDGRTITLALPPVTPDCFSATVTGAGDEAWSEPAAWMR